MTDDPGGSSGGGPQSSDDALRQGVLVALCVFGLIVGATAIGPADDSAGGLSGDGIDLSRLLDLFGEDGSGTRSTCQMALLDDPVPGGTLTVAVLSESGPVQGARVWINDRAVGRTNESGRVTGRVPYERPVEIRARLPDGVSCRQTAAEPSFDSNGVPAGALGAAGSAGAGGRRGEARVAVADRQPAPASARTNITRTVTTDGRISVGVRGRAYPGTTVTVVTRIEGQPVPDATVRVDGTRVGTTDETGRYELAVPDDGRETVRVTVERGDYRGRTTVTVALLEARLAPTTVLAIPTRPAVLQVSRGDDPVPDATVRVDDTRRGETDDDGQLRMVLPADPTATVRVRAGNQTATISLLRVYGGSLALVALVLLVIGAVAVSVLGRLPAPSGVSETTADVRSRLQALLNRVVRRALAVATRLSTLVETASQRLRGLWVDLRRSPRALVARLRALPGAIRRALVAVRDRLRDLPTLLASLRGDGAETTSDPATGTTAAPTKPTEPTTLRERWRAFARWVVPDRWRQRTPAEVVRAATADGYPREPAADLATAFREIEYGGAARTERREERARDAFEALASHRRAEGVSPVSTEQVTERSEVGDR